ncbi:MAG: DNA polymerase Y family protein [Pseudomonadota bacterium]
MSAHSTRRYLSLWLRRLSTDRIERHLSEQVDAPRVAVASIKGAQRITALNDAAEGLGLKVGLGLADARARYPSLPVVDADFEADRRLLEAVADWCDRYTPLVGLDAPDGLFLDITGCAHLFGGEATLARDLVVRLSHQGFAVRVAVADTVGCAWAVARYGTAGIVPKGESAAALMPLPIAALRTEADIVVDLATSGLKRIEDLATRPRAPFAARFGEELVLRLDQALGRIDEPITPRLPVPEAMAEERFHEPIAREADVLGTIEHLARELSRVLERRGEGARLVQLALFRADGKVHRLEIGTGAPLRDPARVRKLFEERLAVLGDACDPGFGYDMVRLSALVTERTDPVQTGLAQPDHAEEMAHLIDRLGARFGLSRITRQVPQNTHIPEFAVSSVPAHAPRNVTRPSGAAALAFEQDSLMPVRPIRLLPKPELIEATAQVPDGPPIRFTWRHVKHQVAHAEGPERIAMEWWRNERGQKLTRDYFRIECGVGARVWVYREGLYGSEVERPRWFVHGLFA